MSVRRATPARDVHGAVLEIADLVVSTRIDGVQKRLVDGVALEVGAGEAVAIVGESGSGKSLTALAIAGLLPRGLEAAGKVAYGGRSLLGLTESERAALRGRDISMILQDPSTMLHPMRRCGEQIADAWRGRNRRGSRGECRAAVIGRLREVGLPDPEAVIDKYPFELSGGLRQRVAIAAGLALDPQLLIADEPSTALDVTTQKEILELLRRLQANRGMALILITHDLRVAFSICQRVHVFYAGSVVEQSPADAMRALPLHPYTLGLLLAEPPVDRRLEELVAIPGSVPDPDDVRGTCPFAARCTWVAPECRAAEPPLEEHERGREAACVRHAEIRADMAAQLAKETRGAAVPASVVADGEQLLEVSDVEVHYRGRRRRNRDVHALRGVSLELRHGESVGLVGESGSGKTTLGRCLTGLVTPAAGTIRIDGHDATSYARLGDDVRRTLRETVQMIFQDPYSSLNPARTIGATLGEALAVRLRRPARPADVEELLDRVGLPADYRSRKPIALSGGERQRVAIARAIAVRPKLIVCDEPVSALDVSVQAQILNVLKAVREELGCAYLFITHDLAVVRQIADRTYVMYRGELVEDGPTAQLLDRPVADYTRRLVGSIPGSRPAASAIREETIA